MKAGQEFIGMPVYSIKDGRHLGTVKDLYVDEEAHTLTGLYLGQEGLLSRKAKVIAYGDISVFGDATFSTFDQLSAWRPII